MRTLFVNLLISLLTLTSPALGEVGSQTDVERAAYWKSKGYDFDPSVMSTWQMDREVREIQEKAKDVERAAYWKSKGYDFDPSVMSTWQMDREVREIQEKAKDVERAALAQTIQGDSAGKATTGVVPSVTSIPESNYSRTTTPSYSSPSTQSRYTDYNYRPPVGDHRVSGYYRRDGTYVAPHYKTNRDDSFWNNYSSRGNLNPYTGRIGSKVPSSGYSYKAPSYKAPSYKAPSYKVPSYKVPSYKVPSYKVPKL